MAKNKNQDQTSELFPKATLADIDKYNVTADSTPEDMAAALSSITQIVKEIYGNKMPEEVKAKCKTSQKLLETMSNTTNDIDIKQAVDTVNDLKKAVHESHAEKALSGLSFSQLKQKLTELNDKLTDLFPTIRSAKDPEIKAVLKGNKSRLNLTKDTDKNIAKLKKQIIKAQPALKKGKKIVAQEKEEAEQAKKQYESQQFEFPDFPKAKSLKDLKNQLYRVNILWHMARDTKNKDGELTKTTVMPAYDIVKGLLKYIKFAIVVNDPRDEDAINRAPLYFYNPDTHLYAFSDKLLQNLIGWLSPETTSTREYNDIASTLRARAMNNIRQLTPARIHTLVAVKNGVFNLQTHKLEPYKDNETFTTQIGTDYNPKAVKEPLFGPEKWGPLKFIKSIAVDSDLAFSQEKFDILLQVILACIQHNFWRRKLVEIIDDGTGHFGKSTFLEIIKQILTTSNYASVLVNDFSDSAQLLQAVNKGTIFSDDYNWKVPVEDPATLKNIISNGPVKIHKMFHDRYSTKLNEFCLAAGNGLISVRGSDGAAIDRLYPVRFFKRFVGTKDNPKVIHSYVKDKRTREFMLNYVLNHAIDRPWPDTAEEHEYIQQMREDTDPMSFFVDTVLPRINGRMVPTVYMYNLFRVSCLSSRFDNSQLPRRVKFTRDFSEHVKGWKKEHKKIVISQDSGWDESNAELFNEYNNDLAVSRRLKYDPTNYTLNNSSVTYDFFVRADVKGIEPIDAETLTDQLEQARQIFNQSVPFDLQLTRGQLRRLEYKAIKKHADAQKKLLKEAKAADEKGLDYANKADVTVAKAVEIANKPDVYASALGENNNIKSTVLADEKGYLKDIGKKELPKSTHFITPWLKNTMYYTNGKNSNAKHVITIKGFKEMAILSGKLEVPFLKSTKYTGLFIINDLGAYNAISNIDPSRFVQEQLDKQNTKKSATHTALNKTQADTLDSLQQIENNPTDEQKRMLDSGWAPVVPSLPNGLTFTAADQGGFEQKYSIEKWSKLVKFNFWYIKANTAVSPSASQFIQPAGQPGIYWFNLDRYQSACRFYRNEHDRKGLGQYKTRNTYF